jgi:hypothetical protein
MGGINEKNTKLKIIYNLNPNNDNDNDKKKEEEKEKFKEKDKDSFYHSKYLNKHNLIKNEKNQIFSLRETFINTYNEKKEKEAALFDLLNSNSANLNNTQLNSCVETYKNLIKTMSSFPLNSKINEIHKIISSRKQSFYSSVVNNNKSEFHNKKSFQEFMIDIKRNKWIIDESILNKIKEKIN